MDVHRLLDGWIDLKADSLMIVCNYFLDKCDNNTSEQRQVRTSFENDN